MVLSGLNPDSGRAAQEWVAKREAVTPDYHPLDVTDRESIATFAEWLRSEYRRADILVNNAGVLPTSEMEASMLTVEPDVALAAYSTNALGALRVSQALIPIMKRRNYGRIVNVSTPVASLERMPGDVYPLAPSYRLSKVALNGITRLLARELAGTDLLVNSYSPGWVRTEMGGSDAPYSPEEAAETAVYLATLPSPHEEGFNAGAQGGFFAEMRKFGGPVRLPW